MRLFCNVLSALFHPLLMVTYSITLALTGTFLALYPLRMKLFIWGSTFLSTAVLPGLFIYLLIRCGAASDLELSKRRERALPYLIVILSVALCLYFLFRMMMPFWLIAILIGICVALLLALCINFVWKISAHMIGIGGLMGGLMGVARIHLVNPYQTFIAVLLIAGLLGTSRIFLKRHTPMQVYAGFSLGFMCTFVASMMSYIYLFI